MIIEELKLTDKRKSICERLDLKTTNDILNYYPFKYEELVPTPYADFKLGQNVFFEGEMVSAPSTYRYAGKRSITRFKLVYEEEEITVAVFNQPWLKGSNNKITVYGKYDGNNKVTASKIFQKDISDVMGIQPYYSLKEGISQNEIKKLIEFTFNKVGNSIEDIVPGKYIKAHSLIDYKSALYNIHNPLNKNLLRQALARLKYEEFLRFYASINFIKGRKEENLKSSKDFDLNLVQDFIDSLPFKMTKDQESTTNDILKDLKSDKLMYRLVQGEVGSGKTAVAMVAMYANYLANYQSALMAPTEILAKQHFESFKKQFENTDVRIELLYSGSNNAKEIKDRLKNGDIDIIIGTHALFQESVEYKNLGLVIADEQHRFGVKQRKALKDKGDSVDFILMSATPIPRTLASSLYGDMDVSTIESLPSGRKGCKTYLIKKNSVIDILDDIKNKLKEGRQIYIIAAAIEASENYSAKDASGLYASLKKELKPFEVGLLHGKMSSDEKDLVMSKFNQNEIQVLISTTVVEVGVNVKNATMMIIYDADKFGLSQLHQLRGRVQRGNYEGSCYLLTGNIDPEVIKRLNVLCESNDGFKISYEDLKLRGPGDILGTRQSGLPGFILGNLIEDTKFIDAARKDANEICSNLDDEENKKFFDHIAFEAKSRSVD